MANLCPKCARPVDADSYCSHCNLTVGVYSKIKESSKALYNQGLQKAKVRDLSASIDLLSRSVRLDKHNIDARNLLGLIYFEIGETVLALQQWVLSKNLKDKDNEAIYFLKQVQDNQSYLDKLNQAIKKYNQSLTYIEQGSTDLAIIQLKKVASLNPKFVKAYALLALCYIKDGEFDKAKRNLHKILTIDKSNYIARKYLDDMVQEAGEEATYAEEVPKERTPSIGLRPVRTKMNGALFQFIAMAIGVAVGLAVMNFMVMPGRIDEKDVQINDITAELNRAESDGAILKEEVSRLEKQLKDSQEAGTASEAAKNKTAGQLRETTKVLSALNLYISDEGNVVTAAQNLFTIDVALLTAEVSGVYDSLVAQIYPVVAKETYDDGYRAYQRQNFDEAIELLTASFKYSKTETFSHRALYFLARSYYRNDQIDTSLPLFQKLLDEYPDSNFTDESSYFINLNTD